MFNEKNGTDVKKINFSPVTEYEKYRDELSDFEIAEVLLNSVNDNKKIKISNKLYTKKKEK